MSKVKFSEINRPGQCIQTESNQGKPVAYVRKWENSDTSAALASIWKQLKGLPSVTLEALPARSNASSLKVNDEGVISPRAAHQARRRKRGYSIIFDEHGTCSRPNMRTATQYVRVQPVSYTHLDVYKRQLVDLSLSVARLVVDALDQSSFSALVVTQVCCTLTY